MKRFTGSVDDNDEISELVLFFVDWFSILVGNGGVFGDVVELFIVVFVTIVFGRVVIVVVVVVGVVVVVVAITAATFNLDCK